MTALYVAYFCVTVVVFKYDKQRTAVRGAVAGHLDMALYSPCCIQDSSKNIDALAFKHQRSTPSERTCWAGRHLFIFPHLLHHPCCGSQTSSGSNIALPISSISFAARYERRELV